MTGVGWVLDLGWDHHVHSTFSDDARSTPAENLAAAAAAGLTSIRMVDHVRRDTTYVPEFLAAVASLVPCEGVQVHTGVEAKILDVAGSVDAPSAVLAAAGGPGGPDRVLLADHQFPGERGPLSPSRMRELLAAGLSGAEALDQLVTAYVNAMARTGPAQLAHPFSILPKIGLSESGLTTEHLDALTAAALAADTVVEVNEKWRCPGPAVVAALHASGVRLVASSDAHDAAEVGRYTWLSGPGDQGGPRSR